MPRNLGSGHSGTYLSSIKVLRHYYDQSRTITPIQLTGLIGVGFSSARGYFLLDVKGRM